MKNWIEKLCPEIADWQVNLIVEQVDLAVAVEREACAKVCDDIAWSSEGKFFAKSIRARSNQTLLESKS
jgi:hypothetical protein